MTYFKVKPHIDRNAMKPIVVKVGQNVEFDVPVTGEPPPDKIWKFNDSEIISTDRVKVSN